MSHITNIFSTSISDSPSEMCQVKIWSQPWKNLRTVTHKSCRRANNELPAVEEPKVIGGDGHDQAPHGKVLGGDGHDQAPHGKVLGGDGHDQVPHGKVLGGDGHDLAPHGKVLGGDGHDQAPHGKVLGGDGHNQAPHGKVLGGDGHDQAPHGVSDEGLGQGESFDADPDLGLERHNIQKKVLISSIPSEAKPTQVLGEEMMPLLSKPSQFPFPFFYLIKLLQATKSRLVNE
jgi:hypothetical protein